MVREFIDNFRDSEEKELLFFRKQPFNQALESAALAKDSRGKRFGHQRRLKRISLQEARRALLEKRGALEEAKSFEAIHSTLLEITANVHGLGELYAYDTALRISAARGCAPKHVYLHAGTRVGAKQLGLNATQGYLPMASLPKALQPLLPHEVESFLCIYKNHFGATSKRRA